MKEREEYHGDEDWLDAERRKELDDEEPGDYWEEENDE